MRRVLFLVVLALVAVPMAGAQAATSHSADLASGRVDGQQILGRTIAA